MNVIIPIVYLMNDEETKGIIAEEGWYQGIRHMMGIYIKVRNSVNAAEQSERTNSRNEQKNKT